MPGVQQRSATVDVVVELEEPLRGLLKSWHRAAETEAAAVQHRRNCEAELRSVLEPIWDKMCRAAGAHHERILLDAGGSAKVIMVHHRRLKRIPPDAEPELRRVLGDQSFSVCFEVKNVVNVDLHALTTTKVGRIVRVLGDTAGTAFTLETRIEPREQLFIARLAEGELGSKLARAESRGLVTLAASCFAATEVAQPTSRRRADQVQGG